MVKHAKKADRLEVAEQPQTRMVEISLPLLGAFANIERAPRGDKRRMGSAGKV